MFSCNLSVNLFEREEPGSAASYGNAGHFSPYASVPLNRPDVIADVPSMLISSRGPLALKWNYVPKMIPWFARFILNCRQEKMMHTAKNMHQILDLSLPAFDELFEEIDLDGLVENNGILYVWTDQNMKSRELEIRIRDQLGVKQQLVNKKEINFIGKEALQDIKSKKIDRSFIMLNLKDSKPGSPLLLHDEPIYFKDKIIGRTTSGNYSFNFKKNLAFGYIDNIYSTEKLLGDDLFIEVEKHKYQAKLLQKPLKQTNFKNI